MNAAGQLVSSVFLSPVIANMAGAALSSVASTVTLGSYVTGYRSFFPSDSLMPGLMPHGNMVSALHEGSAGRAMSRNTPFDRAAKSYAQTVRGSDSIPLRDSRQHQSGAMTMLGLNTANPLMLYSAFSGPGSKDEGVDFILLWIITIPLSLLVLYRIFRTIVESAELSTHSENQPVQGKETKTPEVVDEAPALGEIITQTDTEPNGQLAGLEPATYEETTSLAQDS
jgi:hypothetical protein